MHTSLTTTFNTAFVGPAKDNSGLLFFFLYVIVVPAEVTV